MPGFIGTSTREISYMRSEVMQLNVCITSLFILDMSNKHNKKSDLSKEVGFNIIGVLNYPISE